MPATPPTTPSPRLICNLGFRLSRAQYDKLLTFAADRELNPGQAMRLILDKALRDDTRGGCTGEQFDAAGIGRID